MNLVKRVRAARHASGHRRQRGHRGPGNHVQNLFNSLNLAPFQFNSNSTQIENADFGRATSALAGRVIELQARFSF